MAVSPDQYDNYFAEQVEKTAAKFTFFGIDFSRHIDAAMKADAAVVDAVAKLVKANPAPTDDVYRDTARKFVDGKITAAKAYAAVDTAVATKTGPNGYAPGDVLASLVAQTKRGDIAKKNIFSPAAMYETAADQIADQIDQIAADMVDAVHAAPKVIRERLTQTVAGNYGSTFYGGRVDGDLFEALGDYRHVSGADLDATRRVIGAFEIMRSGQPGAGRDQAAIEVAVAANVTPVGRPVEPVNMFAVLLDADTAALAAALDCPHAAPLSYLIATGQVTELSPLTRPLTDDRDEYDARVKAIASFKNTIGVNGRNRSSVFSAWETWRAGDRNDTTPAGLVDFDFSQYSEQELRNAAAAVERYGRHTPLSDAVIAVGGVEQARRAAEAAVYPDDDAK